MFVCFDVRPQLMHRWTDLSQILTGKLGGLLFCSFWTTLYTTFEYSLSSYVRSSARKAVCEVRRTQLYNSYYFNI